MDYLFEGIGYLGGLALSVSFIPQAWKTFKTKDVAGLSLGMYSIYNLGVLCWIIYGFYLRSVQMVLFNSICICFSFPVLLMVIKYGKKR